MTQVLDTAAVILSGGRSRRLGGADKAWLEVDGRPIVQRQLDVLRERFSAIAMVVGPHGSVRDLPVASLADHVGGLGPLDGIVAGLRWCQSEWLFVVACDMPGLSLPVTDVLLAARTDEVDLVAARIGGYIEPMCALYRRRCLPTLLGRLERRDLALQGLFRADSGLLARFVEESALRIVDPQLAAFHNVNRREDLLTPPDRIE